MQKSYKFNYKQFAVEVEKSGKTLRELSYQANVDVGMIRTICRGLHVPGCETLFSLLVAMGFDTRKIDSLFNKRPAPQSGRRTK